MMEQAHDPDQQLAERYFLGELTDTEAEAYEAHYFDCAGCAEYVREVQILFDSGRDAADRNRQVKPAPVANFNEARRRRRLWMSAAAAAMVVLAVLVPVTRPKPRPFVYSPNQVEMEFSSSRAEVEEAPVFRVGESISLSVIAAPEASEGDWAVIRDADTRDLIPGGKKLTQADIDGPFVLQPSALPAGRYEVVIERADGNRRTRIAATPFEVRR